MKVTSIRIPQQRLAALADVSPDKIVFEGSRRFVQMIRVLGPECANSFVREVGSAGSDRIHQTIRLCKHADKALDIVARGVRATRSDVFRAFLYL